MVDLELASDTESYSPRSPSDEHCLEMENDSDDAEQIYCRLCHGQVHNIEDAWDIYTTSPVAASFAAYDANVDLETQPAEKEREKSETLKEFLKDIFQIEYEEHELLPRHMCNRCLEKVREFHQYRQLLFKSERRLQNELHEVKLTYSKYRPGLNGNPGVFVTDDENDEIIEIDPEQDFLSSDDEFSMETDSEHNAYYEEDWASEEDDEETENILATTTATTTTTTRVNDMQTTDINSERNFNNSTAAGQQLIPRHDDDLSHAIVPSDGGAAALAAIATPNFMLGVHPKNTYLCQYCDLAFTTQNDCYEHETGQHDPIAPYVCSFCQLRQSTRQALINHIKEQHNSERPYVCAHCNKCFCRRSDLKKHTIVHTGARPFTCPECSKSFSRNTNLRKHIRIHSSIKPYVCQVCPRAFPTAAELSNHTRTHTDVKPYQCNRCPSSFTRKDKLVAHEQMHLRRNAAIEAAPTTPMLMPPYVKTEATAANALIPLGGGGAAAAAVGGNETQAFYAQSILAAQLQQQQQNYATPPLALPPPPPPPPIPTALARTRNFNCEICNKSFTRERDLQRHKALHLDTLFNCKTCGMGFSRKEKLVRHELEQHMPHYPCNICRIRFSRIEELEHHQKMHQLQHHVALNTQAAMNAYTNANPNAVDVTQIPLPPPPPQTRNTLMLTTQPPPPPPTPLARPSAADMSFYSQMVPTMNLGFYSETLNEDRNCGI